MKKLLRPDEVAKALICSKRTVYRLIKDRELEALQVRGALRVTERSVAGYIARQIELFMESESPTGTRGTT